MPDSAFEHINATELQKVTADFMKQFESYFGDNHAFYNLHLMGHLHQLRERKGCLTEYSTLPFESSYAVIKAGQKPGTLSLGKQSLQTVMAQYYSPRRPHQCTVPLKIATRTTSRNDDSLLAISVDRFIKCTGIYGDVIEGVVLKTEQFGIPLTSDPDDWKKIGVLLYKGLTQETITVRRSDIFGKAVICDGVICSLPINVLADH